MFKIMTRSFYSLIILGLLSAPIQAAVTDPTKEDAALTTNSAVASASPMLMICDGSVETIHRSMDSLAFQPPASIDTQLAEYKAPNALMRKVIQGCAFVSPALTNSLSRSHLNRLYGQMLDLHQNGGGLTMQDFNVCALILASILDNPALGDDYSGFGGLKEWSDSRAWLHYPFREQPHLWYSLFDNAEGQYGANASLVVFEKTGHFGLNEITHSFLRADTENRCHLIPLTLQACAHGGDITGPAHMMIHDYGHASRRGNSGARLTEFLLSPIFERISSWSGVKRRQIEYALFHILHEDGFFGSDGKTQKELGSSLIEGCKKGHGADTALERFVSPWYIHPSLAGATRDIKSFNLDHPETGAQMEVELGLAPFGSCTYGLVYGPNLTDPCTATLVSTRKGVVLSAPEEALYAMVLSELPPRKIVDPGNMFEELYKGGMKDEVATLKWLYSGKWSLQNAGDTWQDVRFYLDEMPKIYDALMAVGLELWTDEPVPADILATVR